VWGWRAKPQTLQQNIEQSYFKSFIVLMVAPPRDGAIRVAKNVWGLGQNLGAVRPSSIEPKPPRKQTSFDVRCPCSSVSF